MCGCVDDLCRDYRYDHDVSGPFVISANGFWIGSNGDDICREIYRGTVNVTGMSAIDVCC